MREVKAAGEGGVPLNKYLKQVGERGSVVTKTSEKASRPPRDIFFLCCLEKQDGSHWELNSICNITADSDLCAINSNSTFPIWHSRNNGFFPTTLQLLC